jgi:hypothetical protein
MSKEELCRLRIILFQLEGVIAKLRRAIEKKLVLENVRIL